MIIDAKRLADEPVYLNENRYDTPKEIFKEAGRIIKEADYPAGSALLDIGCATGELLCYFKRTMKNFTYFCGMDISEAMINKARKHVPGVNFLAGSLLNDKLFSERRYDVVVCIGVTCIFDDIEAPIKNILACVRKGGLALIATAFNDDPIDVVMRYRKVSTSSDSVWERGWNIFSCSTVEGVLRKSSHRIEYSWEQFRMPFALEKRPDDPMRAWTIETKGDPYQQVNGACQLLNFKILKVRLIEPKD